MKLVYLSFFLLFTLFTGQAQNLLTNGNFEDQLGQPNCDGWLIYDTPFNDLCSNNNSLSSDTPLFYESWSFELTADFPDNKIIKTYATGISGTYVYQLSYYAKSYGGVDIGASFGLSDENITNWTGHNNNDWQMYSIIDTFTTTATDSIIVQLGVGAADFCFCGGRFDVVELKIINTLNDEECFNQDIIFPAGSNQQGNYRTSTTIESRATITDHTKLMATERVRLLNGFSTPNNFNFTANNEGCNFGMNGWSATNLDTGDFNKIYLPNTYSAGVFFGDDTWGFNAYRSDHKVDFGYEEGPGTPGGPLTLTAPLPQNYNGYEKRIIYAAFDNNTINGAFYFKNSGGTFRDVTGFYLHYNGINYTQVLSVSYASSEQQEVIAILETISPCVITAPAIIRYDGSPVFDGCEYIIAINGEDYKPVNQEVIDDSYFTGNPVEVTLAYTKIPELIQPCFAPIFYKQLNIESIVY